MDIYVEKNGQAMGPFTTSQLKDLLASKMIENHTPAWLANETTRSTVAQFLTQTSSSPAGRSSKLQRPSGLAPISPESVGSRFRPGRRLRVVEVPQPTIVERLRMIGGVTPILVLVFLSTPFYKFDMLIAAEYFSGYRAFEAVSQDAPSYWLLAIVFIAATIGIAAFSVRGSLHGAAAMPEAIIPCTFTAIVSFAVLIGALDPDSRLLTHVGGSKLVIAAILTGTGFGIMPGYNNSPEGTITSWATCSILGLAALVMFILGFTMR